MDVRGILRDIGGGHRPTENLSLERADEVFGAMLDGEVAPLQLGALLLALRWKRETPEELAGFARAVARRAAPIPLPDGLPRTVVIPSYARAHCRQPNLMPMLALLLGRFGLQVIIHGNPHPECRSQSFDVLARLGYLPASSRADIDQQLALHNLAIVSTDLIAPGLGRLLKLRSELGVGNSADLVARLLDPCPGNSLRLICISDPELLGRLRNCVEIDPAPALLMRATDGEAYANPSRRPRIEFLSENGSEVLFQAGSGEHAPQGLPQPGDIVGLAQRIADTLAGHRQPPLPLLNQVAACLYASGQSPDLTHAKATVALGLPAAV